MLGGTPRYIADYYISSGKNGSQKVREGDKKTPIGVYFVTANVPREKLTDFYGRGAFPINYPNEWDKRHGRSGFGIWLHGTPSDTYSRPPRASDGCVVLSNQDLDRISATLQVGMTPVIISDGIEWIDPLDALKLARQTVTVIWKAGAAIGKAEIPRLISGTTGAIFPPATRTSPNGHGTSVRLMRTKTGSRWESATLACFSILEEMTWWSSISTRNIPAIIFRIK